MRNACCLILAVLATATCFGRLPYAGTEIAALQRQDWRLDKAYRHLRYSLRAHPQKQAEVRNEQRDWLQHRDFACSGSVGAEHTACLIRETRTKADQVEARLH